MHYRQDTRVKSDRKRIIGSQGGKISQVVFDKEITQQWQVKTNEPTQILPYLLKRLCLSRTCEFWHQMKFFYFENYELSTKNEYQQHTWAKQSNLLQDWEESVILVRVTPQRIQQSKRFLKTLWKITRQRMMSSMNRIKHHAGVQDESSLQIEDEKLNSYMRFLKLQQNKRIDIAIQTLDSVMQKNTKKKLLNGFLNMRERLKQVKKVQAYTDRIRLQCFVDIVMRSIKRENMSLVKSAFEDIELRGEFMRRRMWHQSKSSQLVRRETSSKKVQKSQQQQQKYQQTDTINKLKRRPQTDTPLQLNKKQTNNQSTIKRQVVINSKQIIQSSIQNKNSKRNLHKESDIKSISSHEQIIQSQYYYDEIQDGAEMQVQGGREGFVRDRNEEQQQRQYHHNQEDIYDKNNNFIYNNINNNSLPTKRAYHHQRTTNYQNLNNQQHQQNINNQQNIIHKKTARTPSRITQNFYHSQNLEPQPSIMVSKQNTRSQHQTAHKQNIKHQLHIPITQRIQKHFYQEHYEEQQQEVNNNEDDQQMSQNNNNVHQQICVIRNVSSTPQRKPDRYQKIPILSNNIEFRQFFIDSKKKTNKIQASTHSTSYYERQCCEGCQYCTRLKKINQMMTFLQSNKNVTQKTYIQSHINYTYQINPTQKFIQSQEYVIKSNHTNNQAQNVSQKSEVIKMISKTQQINAFSKKQSQKEKLSSMKVNMDSSKVIKQPKNQRPKPQTTTSRKVNYSKDQKPSSTLRDIRRSGFTPSGQSLMSKSTYSKGLSERKMFSRKPMY